jgi:hypothetical protein
VRELDGVDVSGGSDNVSNVTDGGTAGRSQVQDLRTRLHVDVVKTTQDTGSKLGTEGVPDTVLGLGHGAILLRRRLHGDTLLAVDSLSGGQVLGNKQIFLATAGNENTGVTVGFLRKKLDVSSLASIARILV